MTARDHRTSLLDRRGLLGHVVQLATFAPSVGNTQPWRFVAGPDSLALHVDRSRTVIDDPLGRQQLLSCGAVLHHLRVAARAAGLLPVVATHPDGARPDLLARVTLHPDQDVPAEAVDLARALLRRHTHVGAFRPRAVDGLVTTQLQVAAAREGAAFLPVTRPRDAAALQQLLARAEQPVGSSESTVLAGLVPHQRGDDSAPPARRDPLLGLLTTTGDDERAWLQAGQALSAVLVEAARHGVLGQPLYRVVERPGLRRQLAADLHVDGHVQVALRLGHAGGQVTTVRRALSEVLLGDDGRPLVISLP